MLILYHNDFLKNDLWKKIVKALLSEKWAALHYAPSEFGNGIKKA